MGLFLFKYNFEIVFLNSAATVSTRSIIWPFRRSCSLVHIIDSDMQLSYFQKSLMSYANNMYTNKILDS